MAKKRKNAAKPSQSKIAAESSSSKMKPSKDNRPASAAFESFPLHLVAAATAVATNPSQQYPQQQRLLELKELCPSKVWVIPRFFSPHECQQWINFSEDCGGLEYSNSPGNRNMAQRECYRMQQNTALDIVSDVLYRRFEPVIHRLVRDLYPLGYANNYQPVGFNPNLRLYKYTKGHAFGRHVDGSNRVDGVGRTEITVLVYLSSCKGGATRFYTSDRKNKSFAFDPEPGTMLLHVHGDNCLEHEAEQVLDGTKYVLRTDVVFAKNNTTGNN
jgi:hypothetical protein